MQLHHWRHAQKILSAAWKRWHLVFALCFYFPGSTSQRCKTKINICFGPKPEKTTHTHTQKTCNFFSVIFSHHFFHPKTGAKSQLRKVGNQSSNFPSSPSSPSSRARSFTTACHEGVEVFTHDENPPKQGLSMKIYGKFIGNSLHFPHETPHLLG